MPDYRLVIIGAGLSGLAAGIRAARFGKKTLIVEQHRRTGGLNSWYTRQGRLLETGLHAMTNFAPPEQKKAPLNLLFRQLKLSRRDFPTREQIGSEIAFPGVSLRFSNDPDLLETEIARAFPARIDGFRRLRQAVAAFDPFAPAPWQSARAFVADFLRDPLLEDMLFLPIMLYGNAEEDDMALAQFVIMFRALFEEGLFRPETDMRAFLDMLTAHYTGLGGELRLNADAAEILRNSDGRACGLRLKGGETISADAVLSTAGLPETMRLMRAGQSGHPEHGGEADGWTHTAAECSGRMSFTETISFLPASAKATLRSDRTLIFYNTNGAFRYHRPDALQDSSWGVVCFPDNFQGIPEGDSFAVRVTNAASYPLWQALDQNAYAAAKTECRARAVAASEAVIGPYAQAILAQDSFTPLTIARFTRKAEGAVYGSPVKIPGGETPWPGLFIAGTDQGYLGIVGSMLSGISIVNRHLLP